ncbi:MAG: hypothetical protein R3B13_21160 [Polyangiaceae bacterium]
MPSKTPFVFVAAAIALITACGGSTDGGSAGSGGTGGGSSGSSGSGGNNCGPLPGAMDCMGCEGFVPPDCVNGSWQCPQIKCPGTGGSGGGTDCGPPPGGVDCMGCYGYGTLECDNGYWHCPDLLQCDCAADEIATAYGCMACDVAAKKVNASIESWHQAYGSCVNDDDCAMAPADTKCFGSCGVPVSKKDLTKFTGSLPSLDTEYCQNYAASCPVSSPSCAPGTVFCNAGTCDVKY